MRYRLFDLETFDKELARRFRKPERRLFRGPAVWQSRTSMAIASAVAAMSISAMTVASTSALNAAAPVPMTSDMTYNGMTIEVFAQEVGISIYDPYVLLLFEELCMAQES